MKKVLPEHISCDISSTGTFFTGTNFGSHLHHFEDDFFMLIFFTVDTRNLSKKYRELCLLYAHMRLFYYVFCLFWVN